MDRKPVLWIVAVVVALIAGWQLASAQGEKAKAVQKWEYKTTSTPTEQASYEVMQKAGDDGWELVAAERGILYFKRPK